MGRVNAAIAHMLTARGMDHAFGARIPALLREGRLQWSAVENEAPVAKPIAAMMQMSGHQLVDECVATGCATIRDVARYCSFACVVRGLGQRR